MPFNTQLANAKKKLSIDCKLDMFDIIVKSILLFMCKLCRFSYSDLVKKLHLKFCKDIYLYLEARALKTNCMVYGELGYSFIINIKTRKLFFQH